MDIKVIGTGCDKCDKLYANVLQALETLEVKADVKKIEDLVEIVQLGVMSSPSLMINGKIYVSGRVVNSKSIMKYIEKER